MQQVQLALQCLPPSSLRFHRTIVHPASLRQLTLLQLEKSPVHPLQFGCQALDLELEPAELPVGESPERIGVCLGPQCRISVGAPETGTGRSELQRVGQLLADRAADRPESLRQISAGGREALSLETELSLEVGHRPERQSGQRGRQSADGGAALHAVSFPEGFPRLGEQLYSFTGPVASKVNAIPQYVRGLIDSRPFGIASVTEFGALNNGRTDCTTAFNAALASPARLIVVPPGFYRTTAPLTIPYNSGKWILGLGGAKSVALTVAMSGENAGRAAIEYTHD